ncbi:MFS transporter [Deinococcota bacterium DY0809b]
MRRWLELAPWPPGRLAPLATLIALVGLVELTRTGLYTVYLPRSLGPILGLGVVGLAASLQYLSDTLGRSAGGHLGERHGLRRVLFFAAALAAVSALGVLHAPGVGWLLAASLANGLIIAPLWPAMMTYSSRAARDGEDGRAVGFTQSLVAPFIGLGVLLTGFLFDHDPRLAAAALAAVQALVFLLGTAILLRFRTAAPQPEPTSPFPWRKLASLAPGALTQLLAFGLLAPVFFPFIDRLGLGTRELLLALALGGGLEYLLLSPLGRLADRIGPARTLAPALVLAALTLIGFAEARSLSGLIVAALAAGLAQALLIPSWGGLVSRTLPDEHKARAWGALMSLEGLGFALGPVVGGFAWELWGPRAPFWIGAIAYLGVALFYAVRLRRSAGA